MKTHSNPRKHTDDAANGRPTWTGSITDDTEPPLACMPIIAYMKNSMAIRRQTYGKA